VAKCEKQRRDERRQAPSTHRSVRRPLFAQDDDEVFVTGSTLYAGDEAPIFDFPGNAPAIITQYVAWMEEQFSVCQTPHERDGRTDRRTPDDGNSRAMHSIARQKLRCRYVETNY